MSAAALLARLRALGVTATVAGGDLALDAPAGVLTPELLSELRAHKGALLALLAAERWTADPRPDLAGDSTLWRRLLGLAYGRDFHDPHGLFGALHGLRCCGAVLARGPGGLRLLPGELPPAEYVALRGEYLVPYAPTLRALLAAAGAGERGEGRAPDRRPGCSESAREGGG